MVCVFNQIVKELMDSNLIDRQLITGSYLNQRITHALSM